MTQFYRLIVAVSLALLAACTFVSKGTVVIGGNCLDCKKPLTDDTVALVAAPVFERHNLQPVWSTKAGNSPCTGARGCTWAPEGKGWLQPWVLISTLSPGQVNITIESRHDAPGQESRVSVLTEEVAKAMRDHFGKDIIVIERFK